MKITRVNIPDINELISSSLLLRRCPHLTDNIPEPEGLDDSLKVIVRGDREATHPG